MNRRKFLMGSVAVATAAALPTQAIAADGFTHIGTVTNFAIEPTTEVLLSGDMWVGCSPEKILGDVKALIEGVSEAACVPQHMLVPEKHPLGRALRIKDTKLRLLPTPSKVLADRMPQEPGTYCAEQRGMYIGSQYKPAGFATGGMPK